MRGKANGSQHEHESWIFFLRDRRVIGHLDRCRWSGARAAIKNMKKRSLPERQEGKEH